MLITQQVWSEEFRPTKLKDIVGQPAVAVLEGFVRNKCIVDCNLVGPSGIGKTTAIKAMFYELYDGIDSNGIPYYETNTLILNASDERKLETIRGAVKDFTTYEPTHPNVPFRTIYLDEVDGLLGASQDALRGIIEANSKNCRFILSCNELGALIEALQSRGPPIPFFKIQDEDMLKVLTETCTKHGVTITEDAVKTLLLASNGDLRSMLKRLQMAAMINPAITSETLAKFIHTINDSTTEKIMRFAFEKDFVSARSLLIELYATAHYDAKAILTSIDRNIVKMEKDFPNPMSYWKTISKISDAYIKIQQSANPLYVLIALMSEIILIQSIPIHCFQLKE